MWNRYRQTGSFRDGNPWLLRFFDQIRFYEVSEEELLAHRRDFPLGRFDVKIEETSFSLADYNRFLDAEREGIAAFKQKQQAAFEAERERWRESGQAEWVSEEADAAGSAQAELPVGSRYLSAVVPGSVWKIVARPGDVVEEGDTIAILESMKMEIAVKAIHAGQLVEWLVAEGKPVSAGQNIAIFRNIETAAGTGQVAPALQE
jgi:urea carboxylase